MTSPVRQRRRRRSERGQSAIELVLVVNIFFLFLIGIAEYGIAFSHNMTLEYASREGARTGGALGVGSDDIPCGDTDLDGADDIDAYTVAAVQRVLTSPGSPIDIGQVVEVRIYKATSAGVEDGTHVDVWAPGTGPTIDGAPLQFAPAGAPGWPSCTRLANSNPDSVGVTVVYDYHAVTPLADILGVAGFRTFRMTDRTVMSLNPN